MVNFRTVILLVIMVVIAVTLVPTLWETVYDDMLNIQTGCLRFNTSPGDVNCLGNSGMLTTSAYCEVCVNGTSRTLIQLVPFIFVGVTILGGVVLYAASKKS